MRYASWANAELSRLETLLHHRENGCKRKPRKGNPRVIRELKIQNYKSILDHTLELGRINVFIGENGCGKTNILEAVALAAAAQTNKLSIEELFARGIRVAKPSIMRSSFEGVKPGDISLQVQTSAYGDKLPSVPGASLAFSTTITGKGTTGLSVEFISTPSFSEMIDREELKSIIESISNGKIRVSRGIKRGIERDLQRYKLHRDIIDDFAIYNANILALRGLITMSRRTPLGIYGENLDVAMSALPENVWTDVLERAKCVSWLDDVMVDPADERKYQGHKLGQSKSNVYFRDRFMKRKNNVFSAENVNEGILHVLFYLTLFVSEGTPKVFGIDNIETALNPQLCRDLMQQLAELSDKHGKQALITTHNPAILDGMNLLDDEQRLFVVYRNDDGHTVTRRIKQKPDTKDVKYKLSELWMRGHLGGLPPERF